MKTKVIDPDWFRQLIAQERARGNPPIIEIGWGEIVHRFGDEDHVCRFGRENLLAFAIIVTRTWRRCFVMEQP